MIPLAWSRCCASRRSSPSTSTWTDSGSFKETTDFDADLQVAWSGDEAILIIGTGTDHSIFDLYLDGVFWRSIDGYSAQPGEKAIHIPGEGTLRIKNRAEQHKDSSGYRLQFKQLDVLTVTHDEQTIDYEYDAVSRLLQADYNSGTTVYTYGYDLAGNLTNMNGVSRTYNASNQLVNDGTNTLTHDNNGNMLNDGVNTLAWDRANRLLAMGGLSYAYNGDGRRVLQNNGMDVTQYLIDTQPGLAVVLSETDGVNTNHYVHSPRGVHAVNDGSVWTHPMQDGLGSVRGYLDGNLTVLSSINYSEYGVPDASIIGPAFTGEWRDETGVQYHRARYLNPGLGTWLSLDPFEGMMDRPMSLNGYLYVYGNPVNLTDATGSCTDDWICRYLRSIGSSAYEQLCGDRNTNSCVLSSSDVDRIAQIARGEASGMGDYNGEFYGAVAGLGLAEINHVARLRLGRRTFTVTQGWSGVYNMASRDVPQEVSRRIYNIADALVAGTCSRSCGNNPLAVFEGCTTDSALARFNEISDLFPEFAGVKDRLETIMSNPTIVYEQSFYSDNINQDLQPLSRFEMFGPRTGIVSPNILREDEPFKSAVFRGTLKGVVISNAYNAIPLEWNCPYDQNRVINSSFDPNNVPNPSWVANSTCVSSCRRSTWWWGHSNRGTMEAVAALLGLTLGENQYWLKVPDQFFQQEIVQKGKGGSAYVASCQ